eukprot:RCo000750
MSLDMSTSNDFCPISYGRRAFPDPTATLVTIASSSGLQPIPSTHPLQSEESGELSLDHRRRRRRRWAIPAHLLLLAIMLLLIGIPIGLFFALLQLYFTQPLRACHDTISTVSADAYANGQSSLGSILAVAEVAVSQTASPMLQVFTANLVSHVLTTVEAVHSTTNLTVAYIRDAGLDLSLSSDRVKVLRFMMRNVQARPLILNSPSVSGLQAVSIMSILPYKWRGATYYSAINCENVPNNPSYNCTVQLFDPLELKAIPGTLCIPEAMPAYAPSAGITSCPFFSPDPRLFLGLARTLAPGRTTLTAWARASEPLINTWYSTAVVSVFSAGAFSGFFSYSLRLSDFYAGTITLGPTSRYVVYSPDCTMVSWSHGSASALPNMTLGCPGPSSSGRGCRVRVCKGWNFTDPVLADWAAHITSDVTQEFWENTTAVVLQDEIYFVFCRGAVDTMGGLWQACSVVAESQLLGLVSESTSRAGASLQGTYLR